MLLGENRVAGCGVGSGVGVGVGVGEGVGAGEFVGPTACTGVGLGLRDGAASVMGGKSVSGNAVPDFLISQPDSETIR